MFARRNRRDGRAEPRPGALPRRGPSRCRTASAPRPGIWMRVGGAIVACLPGVPSEMRIMFDEQVVPRLRRAGRAGRVIVHRKINLFGKGESDIEADGARPDRARPQPRGRHHRARGHDQLPGHRPRGPTEDEARRAIGADPRPDPRAVRRPDRRRGGRRRRRGRRRAARPDRADAGDRRVVHRRPDRPDDHGDRRASARTTPAGSSATPTRRRSTCWASPRPDRGARGRQPRGGRGDGRRRPRPAPGRPRPERHRRRRARPAGRPRSPSAWSTSAWPTAEGVQTRRLDIGPEQPRDVIQGRSAKHALNWVRLAPARTGRRGSMTRWR